MGQMTRIFYNKFETIPLHIRTKRVVSEEGENTFKLLIVFLYVFPLLGWLLLDAAAVLYTNFYKP